VANLAESRIVIWAERIALLLLVLFIGLHSIPRAWRSLVTDFPNYYMAAHLAHDGYDTSRMYEWTWLQREKNHLDVDVRVIGMSPITPLSTLIMLPLVGLQPLSAKRVWIIFTVALLVPIAWLINSMTELAYRRIALIFAMCVPLYRNLEFGQFYVFLLLLLVAACWSYIRGHYAFAGALIALATACKIFPVLFVVYLVRRRAWRALLSGLITGIIALAISVWVFGINTHYTYLREIFPWALHGEGMPPYFTAASFSGVLHSLFLSEPRWNPIPWHDSPLCYALLLPTLQMLALAPAVLLVRREDKTQRRIMLEWSAFITASLAISTIPASYNFVLMALPVCVLTALFIQRKSYRWLAVLIAVYFGIGFPVAVPQKPLGLAILLYIPRLPLILALLLGIYLILWREPAVAPTPRLWPSRLWAVAMAASVVFSAFSTFYLQRSVRQEYAYRLPIRDEGFLNAGARSSVVGGQSTIRYIAFVMDGYRLIREQQNTITADPIESSSDDDLSFTLFSDASSEQVYVERAFGGHSNIIDPLAPSHVVVPDAREPMLSADGTTMAFVRDDRGRGQLRSRIDFRSSRASESALTPPFLNVYEASFLSRDKYAFSATEPGNPPQIYLTDATHLNAALALGESRYPALSPDQRWMAYSHLEHGVWNLWLRNQQTGATQRIANLACNQIQSTWEADSKTILYSTDCGRSLWFTAVSRRRVIP
jgi:hypothetical protein